MKKARRPRSRPTRKGRPILDVALETTGLSRKELMALLDPAALTKGGIHGGSAGG